MTDFNPSSRTSSPEQSAQLESLRLEARAALGSGALLQAACLLEKIVFLEEYREESSLTQLEKIYRELNYHSAIQKLMKKLLAQALAEGSEDRFFSYAYKLAGLLRNETSGPGRLEGLGDLAELVRIYAKQHPIRDWVETPRREETVKPASAPLKIGFALGGSYAYPLPAEWYQAVVHTYEQKRFELFFYAISISLEPNEEPSPNAVVLSQLPAEHYHLRRLEHIASPGKQIDFVLKRLAQDQLDIFVYLPPLFAPAWNFIASLRPVSFQSAVLSQPENHLELDLQYLPSEVISQAFGRAVSAESVGLPKPRSGEASARAPLLPRADISLSALEESAGKFLTDLEKHCRKPVPLQANPAAPEPQIEPPAASKRARQGTIKMTNTQPDPKAPPTDAAKRPRKGTVKMTKATVDAGRARKGTVKMTVALTEPPPTGPETLPPQPEPTEPQSLSPSTPALPAPKEDLTRDWEAQINAGLEHLNAGRNQEALQTLDQAPASSSPADVPLTSYAKAVALARLGKTRNACDTLRSLLQEIPGHAAAAALLNELEADQKPETAYQPFAAPPDRAESVPPRDGPTPLPEGFEDEDAAAMPDIQPSSSEEKKMETPEPPPFITAEQANHLINLAIQALQQKDAPAAIEFLKDASRFNSPLSDLEYVRGMCHIALNDLPAAQQALTEELNFFPQNKDAQNLLAKVSRQLSALFTTNS